MFLYSKCRSPSWPLLDGNPLERWATWSRRLSGDWVARLWKLVPGEILVGGLVAIFHFPRNIGFLIIPIDFHIFQRSGPTTNQDLFFCLVSTIGMVQKQGINQGKYYTQTRELGFWPQAMGGRVVLNVCYCCLLAGARCLSEANRGAQYNSITVSKPCFFCKTLAEKNKGPKRLAETANQLCRVCSVYFFSVSHGPVSPKCWKVSCGIYPGWHNPPGDEIYPFFVLVFLKGFVLAVTFWQWNMTWLAWKPSTEGSMGKITLSTDDFPAMFDYQRVACEVYPLVN